MKSIIAVISLVLILVGVNASIVHKEKHLATGKIAYLPLRPVDPRSLMQGDFMRLRFILADKLRKVLPNNEDKSVRWRHQYAIVAGDGYVVVTLDDKNIASFQRLYQEGSSLLTHEIKMRYRVRNGIIKFATNAFFFQEGTADMYDKAKFGKFRVNNDGELLLTDMYDKDLQKLVPDLITGD